MTNSALLTQHILYINHHQTKSHRVNIMVFKFQFTHNLIHNVLSQCLVEHDADLPAGIEERLTWRESSPSFFCSNLLPPNGSRRVFITVVSMNEDKLFAVVNNKTFVMVKKYLTKDLPPFLPVSTSVSGTWWMWRGTAETCPSQKTGTRRTQSWWLLFSTRRENGRR